MGVKVKDFVKEVEVTYQEKWGYIWATAGELWTKVKQDALKKKYEELLKTAQKQADMYDELLRQKLDLDAYIPRLKDDIYALKEENKALTAQSSKLRIASDPKNLDTFTLLNTVLEKMKDSKIEYIMVTIDGMCIDIHSAQKVPLRSASYQIRSSEVR